MFLYYLPLIVTVLAAAICFVANDKISKISTLASASVSIIFSLYIWVLNNVSTQFLYIDAISKIMLVTISIIYLTTAIFSGSYFKHISKPLLKKNLYWAFLNLFVLSMFFSVMVNNLGLIWIGIEATTITSALLVAIDNNFASIEASWRYIIIVSVGLVISLVGIIFIYDQTHTLNIAVMLKNHVSESRIILIGSAMAIVGFGTKAGIFPMHTWLPDVHGRSIAPVSAIFSSVLLPSALFGIIRISQIIPFEDIKQFMFILGILTILFASIFMINQKYYKRMFAYSSMENMGMILIGVSLGKAGLLGAMILLVSHAFAKSSVFYLTGNILSVYKTRKTAHVHSLVKNMPYTAYGLILSSLAVTGAPPFAVFIGEFFIISAVYRIYGFAYTIIILLALLTAFLSINYKVAKMSFSERNSTQKTKDEWVSALIPLINLTLSFCVLFAIPAINNILKGITG
ncbi:MAG: hydrogenase 4 subunit F [Epsilonproteobacteria bacterium]|nr:hydrogenase 4 subunit F [Campylobacterota bacterium]